MAFDTHAAVKTLTGAGASEAVAVAVVDVAQAAAAERGRELVTRADLQAEIAALEARLAWRLITAGIAIASTAVAAACFRIRLAGRPGNDGTGCSPATGKTRPFWAVGRGLAARHRNLPRRRVRGGCPAIGADGASAPPPPLPGFRGGDMESTDQWLDLPDGRQCSPTTTSPRPPEPDAQPARRG